MAKAKPEQRADWLVNFQVRPLLRLPGGARAHRGYARAWQSLKDNVLPKLAELNIQHLTVTGHSLGGALATLAVMDMEPQDLHLITFGNPKACGSRLASMPARALSTS